jgi:MFS family permease
VSSEASAVEPAASISVGGVRLLVSAVVAQATVSVAEMGVPTIGPMIKDAFGLTTVGVGLLVAALNTGRIGGSFPSGHFVDRFGEAPAFLFGGAGLSAGMVLAALAPSEALLLAALFVCGVFASSATPAGARLVSRTVASGDLGLALGARQAAVPAGALIAALILPALALSHGVQTALLVAAVFPLIGALVAFLGARKHPMPRDDWAQRRSFSLLRSRPLRYAIGWAALFVSGQYAIITFLVLSLRAETHFSIELAALMLTLSQVGGIVGRIAWGRASDIVPGGPREVLIVISAVGAATACLLASAGLFPSPIFFGAVSFLVGTTLVGWQGAWMNLLAELSPAHRMGTTVGTGLTFQGFGQVLWPPLLGLVAALSGGFTALWLTLAAVLACSLLLLWRLGDYTGESTKRSGDESDGIG